MPMSDLKLEVALIVIKVFVWLELWSDFWLAVPLGSLQYSETSALGSFKFLYSETSH